MSAKGKAKGKAGSDNWIVAETRWGDEFVALRNLSHQEFDAYLPLMRLPANKCGVRRPVPLFEGYIFVRETSRWKSICGTRGVKTALVTDRGTPMYARACEIAHIRSLEDEIGYCSVSPADWARRGRKPGDLASPRSGPWSGQAGRIVEMSGRDRCVLLMSLLGRDVRVNMRTSELA